MDRLASIKERFNGYIAAQGYANQRTPILVQQRKELLVKFEENVTSDMNFLLQRLERCEKVFEKMSTGNFHAPMELSQIEAYKAYATSMLEFLRTDDEAIQP